jgi:hypothetical protein
MNNSPPKSSPVPVLAYIVVVNTDEKPVSTKKSQSVYSASSEETSRSKTKATAKIIMNLFFFNMMVPLFYDGSKSLPAAASCSAPPKDKVLEPHQFLQG